MEEYKISEEIYQASLVTSSESFSNSSLKIQYIAKQPCAASTRDL